jgi:peptidoglycan/xylan/chitin deacetylase (PgdA/CDA1 family)
VLCYHAISPGPRAAGGGVEGAGSEGFERQLEALVRVGNVVGLGDALVALDAGMRLPPRAVAITFDDGYRDNLEVAAPALHRLGLPATFFLAPGFLSRTTVPWWEALAISVMGSPKASVAYAGRTCPLGSDDERRAAYRWISADLKRRSRLPREELVADLVRELCAGADTRASSWFLDWAEARELAALGFEIGSHTLTHPILARESPTVQAHELHESRLLLERELSTRVPVVAYPNGMVTDYDDDTRHAAERAGYRAAVTCRFGWNDARTPPFEMRRVLVDPSSGEPGLVAALANPLRAWGTARLRRLGRRVT